jgi:putative FmdB family regulatory protein
LPTYEYKCTACDHAFEKFQPITSSPIKKCPQCGKSKVKRLIGTGAGLLFKGSGFYITDYRSDSYNKSAKADSSAAPAATGDAKPATDAAAAPAKTEAKAESKSEPAPAPKPEPKRESKSSKKKD